MFVRLCWQLEIIEKSSITNGMYTCISKYCSSYQSTHHENCGVLTPLYTDDLIRPFLRHLKDKEKKWSGNMRLQKLRHLHFVNDKICQREMELQQLQIVFQCDSTTVLLLKGWMIDHKMMTVLTTKGNKL